VIRSLGACAASALLVASSGCAATTDTGIVSGAVTTRITVDPAVFLGNVACGTGPGKMRSYVATLTDVTGPPFDLPSSRPTPCSQPIAFFYVRPGHQYTARIQGYEQEATALDACSGPSSGSSLLVPLTACSTTPSCQDAQSSGRVVRRRWSGACLAAATAVVDDNATFAACDPLLDEGDPAAPPVVDVALGDTLGNYACGPGADQIAYFNVTVAGGKLPGSTNVPCANAKLTFAAGVAPFATYRFDVVARAGKAAEPHPHSALKYRATCTADAQPGLDVRACCTPLDAIAP
jgi:hypothetical protein